MPPFLGALGILKSDARFGTGTSFHHFAVEKASKQLIKIIFLSNPLATALNL